MTTLYVFVIYACDGRHESEPKSWEGAHQDAADWHAKPLQTMLDSHTQEYGREAWEGMDGQTTAVEKEGEYVAFMKAEFGDDDVVTPPTIAADCTFKGPEDD